VSESRSKGLTLSRLVYGSSLKRTLVRALVLAVLVALVFKFVFIPVRVAGLSMAPTYQSNRVNVVNRLAYKRGGPQRGDVVGVWPREGSRSVLLMKRVVGLPGEQVGFRNGVVTIDGIPLQEPYVRYESDWNVGPVTCGMDEYFVVGDNRSMPFELHTLGCVPRKQIAGKMML
jgi:signal peptidase I